MVTQWRASHPPHPTTTTTQRSPHVSRRDQANVAKSFKREAQTSTFPRLLDRLRGRKLHRAYGALGVGMSPSSTSWPASTSRRAARCASRAKRSARMSPAQLAAWRARTIGLRLPVVQPAAGAHGGAERRAARCCSRTSNKKERAERTRSPSASSGSSDRMDHYPRQLSGRTGAARRDRARHRRRSRRSSCSTSRPASSTRRARRGARACSAAQ
jgi:hypothetical protein